MVKKDVFSFKALNLLLMFGVKEISLRGAIMRSAIRRMKKGFFYVFIRNKQDWISITGSGQYERCKIITA